MPDLNGVPTSNIQGSIGWQEYNSQSGAANTAYAGAVRSNAPSGSGQVWGYFFASVYSVQAGTLLADIGFGTGATVNVPAGTTTTVKIPAVGSSFKATFTLAATAGSFNMVSGFTLA